MRRFAILLITAIIIALAASDAGGAKRRQRQQPRAIGAVKKEQSDTRRAIQQTAEQIEANRRSTVRSLNRLDSLSSDIDIRNRTIARISSQIDSIDRTIVVLNDSVAALERRLGTMRDHQRGSTSVLAFIFSAETVTQGYRRMRYLKEVSAWRERRSRELAAQADTLRRRKEHLAVVKTQRATSLAELDSERRQLQTSQQETTQIVAQLKKESTSLRRVLKDKEAKARALEAELERLIAEEQRRQEEEQRRKEEEARRRQLAAEKKQQQAKAAGRPSESAASKTASDSKKSIPAPAAKQRTYATADDTRSLSGTFESNKGRLLFPVSGRYRIVRPFGRHQHPELPHVVTDNAGIDIETSPGATARAVFAGKVSAIFRQPGYNTIVMVRHGRYLTVYAGLTDITVRNGQELKQGQAIGKIFADPDDGDRALLHFELRREKEKLNPSLWVK